jgi:hypothetical protein
VLVCLTRTGLIAHETIVAGALERNQRLLEQLGKDEVAGLLDISIVPPILPLKCSTLKKI